MELEKLDEDVQSPDEIDKSLMTRLRNVFEDIQNPESDLGRTVRAIRSGVRTAQKAAKAYNKVAQWVGLPQVPDMLLG